MFFTFTNHSVQCIREHSNTESKEYCQKDWQETKWREKAGVRTVHGQYNTELPHSRHNTDSRDHEPTHSRRPIYGKRLNGTMPRTQQRGPSVPLPLVLAISTLEPSPFRYANVSMPRNQRKLAPHVTTIACNETTIRQLMSSRVRNDDENHRR